MTRLILPPVDTMPQRTPLTDLVASYGDYSGAFQSLEPHFSLWYAHPRAAVAFVAVHRAWVASGPPLCRPDEAPEVVSGFIQAAKHHGCQAIFFGLTAEEAHALKLGVLPLGEEPYFDLSAWNKETPRLRTLRAQVRRAARLGVVITSVSASRLAQDAKLRRQLDILAARWMALHAMPPMGFVVALHPFDHLAARRLWVAYANDVPVAFASAAPYKNGKAWLVEDIVRARDAPNGTAESLVDTAIEALQAEGVTELSLGIVPLVGRIAPGLGLARQLGQGLYNFAGLFAFKNKFAPTRWQSVTLAWGPQARFSVLPSRWLALIGLLRAFAEGHLFLFGLRTLLRGPRPVLMAMVAALAPWTVGLALLPQKVWFSAPWVQQAWFVFDVCLWILLVILIIRPRRTLRLCLALATTADALITLIEVLNFQNPKTLWGLFLRSAAVLAPLLASVVLWGAWHRLRVMRGDAMPRPSGVFTP